MFDESKLFYLTEDETKKIGNWITENKYTLSSGSFELRFYFSPYGDSVVLYYRQEEKAHYLEVYDDWKRESLPRPADHIMIDGFTAHLDLSEEALEKYFQLGRKCTEAHLNEDCEPPGFGLHFEIHDNICNIFAGERLIETRAL